MASMSTWLQVTYLLFRWKYIHLKKCKIGTANKQFLALDLEFWKELKGLMHNISNWTICRGFRSISSWFWAIDWSHSKNGREISGYLARNILKCWGECQIAYRRLENLRYYQNWNATLIAMSLIMIRILTGRKYQQKFSLIDTFYS